MCNSNADQARMPAFHIWSRTRHIWTAQNSVSGEQHSIALSSHDVEHALFKLSAHIQRKTRVTTKHQFRCSVCAHTLDSDAERGVHASSNIAMRPAACLMYRSRSSLQTSSSIRAMTSCGGSFPSARTSSTASSFTYWLHSRAMSLSVIFLICNQHYLRFKRCHTSLLV